jgi:hypothetical protein
MTLFLFHTVLIPGFRMRSLETNIGLCFVRDLQHSLLRIEKHRCFNLSLQSTLVHIPIRHRVMCCLVLLIMFL